MVQGTANSPAARILYNVVFTKRSEETKNGDGGIRTHVSENQTKRFRVVLVMTTSIHLPTD